MKETITGELVRQTVLECIEEHSEQHGFPPSFREIMKYTGIVSTSVVSYHLKILERQGKIKRTFKLSRAIKINEQV